MITNVKFSFNNKNKIIIIKNQIINPKLFNNYSLQKRGIVQRKNNVL